jgi:hypothetical protein
MDLKEKCVSNDPGALVPSPNRARPFPSCPPPPLAIDADVELPFQPSPSPTSLTSASLPLLCSSQATSLPQPSPCLAEKRVVAGTLPLPRRQPSPEPPRLVSARRCLIELRSCVPCLASLRPGRSRVSEGTRSVDGREEGETPATVPPAAARTSSRPKAPAPTPTTHHCPFLARPAPPACTGEVRRRRARARCAAGPELRRRRARVRSAVGPELRCRRARVADS